MGELKVLLLLTSVLSLFPASSSTKLGPDVHQTGSICMLQLNSHRGTRLHKGGVQSGGSLDASSNRTAPNWGEEVLHVVSAVAGSVSAGLARAAGRPVLGGSLLQAQAPCSEGSAAPLDRNSPCVESWGEVSFVGSSNLREELEASGNRTLVAQPNMGQTKMAVTGLVVTIGLFIVAGFVLVTYRSMPQQPPEREVLSASSGRFRSASSLSLAPKQVSSAFSLPAKEASQLEPDIFATEPGVETDQQEPGSLQSGTSTSFWGRLPSQRLTDRLPSMDRLDRLPSMTYGQRVEREQRPRNGCLPGMPPCC